MEINMSDYPTLHLDIN